MYWCYKFSQYRKTNPSGFLFYTARKYVLRTARLSLIITVFVSLTNNISL